MAGPIILFARYAVRCWKYGFCLKAWKPGEKNEAFKVPEKKICPKDRRKMKDGKRLRLWRETPAII
jgi:hypothetical protein